MTISLFQKEKLLREISTFGIGGPAKFFKEIHTIEEMQTAIKACYNEGIPYHVIGKGSNCLFDDNGFEGAILLNKIDFLQQSPPGSFYAGAGYSFSLLGTQTARQGWTGLEFASGIPGSVGGAIFMNAGANGGEASDYLKEVEFVNEQGNLEVYKKEQISFSYRTSSFQKMNGAIVSATFFLQPFTEARKRQLSIIEYRKQTQPYGDKSAGCVFRNPHGEHAGALIEKCRLKGLQIGGALVSQLHANFIVNRENASAQDVLQLIELIKTEVKEKTGFELESEIRYIPYFKDVK